MQPGHAGAYESEGYTPPQHVALLLPLNAQLAAVSGSIRDGFLAAYFASDDAHRPEIRIYDSGKTPAEAVAAYNQAVTDGADHVVGPLQREAVGELFHKDLSARVLALNHPDTGEVPPAGSAEFGLLPDAEGAQVAEHMHERGINRAIMITADTDWAERAKLAFRAQFEASGGRVVGEAKLKDNDVNFRTSILQATGTLGDASDAGIFISMRPQQARLLLPQLKIASVNAPVFATSHIYTAIRTRASIAISTASNSATRRGCSAPCPGVPIASSCRARSRARTASARVSSRSAWTRTRCCPTWTGCSRIRIRISTARPAISRPTASGASIASSAGRASIRASRGPSKAR